MIALASRPLGRDDTAANPLRRGELVVCPRCEASGPAWEWELQRSPAYAAWTVTVYRCRAKAWSPTLNAYAECRHTFALRGDEAPRAGQTEGAEE